MKLGRCYASRLELVGAVTKAASQEVTERNLRRFFADSRPLEDQELRELTREELQALEREAFALA